MLSVKRIATDVEMDRAVKEAKERYENMTPAEKDSMYATQLIGYVAAEMFPDKLDGERYRRGTLEWLRALLRALESPHDAEAEHGLSRHIRRLTPEHLAHRKAAVEDMIRDYEAALLEQEAN